MPQKRLGLQINWKFQKMKQNQNFKKQQHVRKTSQKSLGLQIHWKFQKIKLKKNNNWQLLKEQTESLIDQNYVAKAKKVKVPRRTYTNP